MTEDDKPDIRIAKVPCSPAESAGCCAGAAQACLSGRQAEESCRGPSAGVATLTGDERWVMGSVASAAGPVPRVATAWSAADHWGRARVRLNVGRMRYAVAPGLYAAGSPTADSPVLVSANYKLSFDRLRRELGGLDAWILVLDTKGVNVWCAAGKGTFGTDELVARMEDAELSHVVSHRTLVVPQLGAPGVAAHEVKKRSGFRVVYGPVRAEDLPAFLAAGMEAGPDMRRVRFGLTDRLAVVPVEVMLGGRYLLAAMAALLLLGGLHRGGYDTGLALAGGGRAALLVLAAFVGGGVIAPLLLPWLPGRMFSAKGASIGLAMACGAILAGWIPSATVGGKLAAAAWLLGMPAIAAFMTMNFTGASTYTSLSGVRREMRLAVPAQIVAATVGLGLWVAARFL